MVTLMIVSLSEYDSLTGGRFRVSEVALRFIPSQTLSTVEGSLSRGSLRAALQNIRDHSCPFADLPQ